MYTTSLIGSYNLQYASDHILTENDILTTPQRHTEDRLSLERSDSDTYPETRIRSRHEFEHWRLLPPVVVIAATKIAGLFIA